MARVSLSAPDSDPDTARKLSKLNDSVAHLNKEAEALVNLGKQPQELFFNCWSLSVPQLLLLLDGINDPAGFMNRLKRFKHVTFHTLDFYRDFGLARRMGLI
jgi:hypothetical protein